MGAFFAGVGAFFTGVGAFRFGDAAFFAGDLGAGAGEPAEAAFFFSAPGLGLKKERMSMPQVTSSWFQRDRSCSRARSLA